MTSRPKEAEKRQAGEPPEYSAGDVKYPTHRVVTEPYKFTLAKVDKICERIRQGTWTKHACQLEFVTWEGLKDAMARDEATLLAIRAAEAENAERIRAKGETDIDHWQKWADDAKKWDPEVWHLAAKSESKNQTEVTGANSGPVVTQVLVCTEAEMLAVASRKLENG